MASTGSQGLARPLPGRRVPQVTSAKGPKEERKEPLSPARGKKELPTLYGRRPTLPTATPGLRGGLRARVKTEKMVILEGRDRGVPTQLLLACERVCRGLCTRLACFPGNLKLLGSMELSTVDLLKSNINKSGVTQDEGRSH